jgi:hypothetical protein
MQNEEMQVPSHVTLVMISGGTVFFFMLVNGSDPLPIAARSTSPQKTLIFDSEGLETITLGSLV